MCLVPYINCMAVKPHEDHSSWKWTAILRGMLIAQMALSVVCFLAFRWVEGVMTIFSALFGLLIFWYRVQEDGFQLLMVMTFVITDIMMAVWSLVAILLFYTTSPSGLEKTYGNLAPWQKDCYKASLIAICVMYVVLSVLSAFLYNSLRKVFVQEAQYQQVPDEDPLMGGTGGERPRSSSYAGAPPFSFSSGRGHRLDE